ncbi:hypothetical protein D3C73_1366400 [compost metagenome]
MLWQQKGGAHRAEYTIVDRCDLGNLQRINRRMDHCASKALIVGGAAGRRGYAQSVPAEHLEGNIVDVHLDDHGSVDAF